MRVGDYVEIRRRIPPRVRQGVRGEVIEVKDGWVTVRVPQGIVQCRPDEVSFIDREESH